MGRGNGDKPILDPDFWDGQEVLTKEGSRSPKRKGAIWFLVFLVVLLLSGFAGVWAARQWLAGDFRLSNPAGNSEQSGSGVAGSPWFNVLVLGSDARGSETGRSDTILLIRFNLQTKEAQALSIPRDTYVNIPGHGETKVNAALAYGGADLALRTVADFLGLPLEKYLVLDFESFARVVDTLGGVNLVVDQRMFRPSEGIDLQPGEQHLDGEEALAFVRWRGDGGGDLGRIPRQQQFINALAAEVLKPATIVRLPRLIPQIENSLDTNLGLHDAQNLLALAQSIQRGGLDLVTLPGKPSYRNGISYFFVDREAMLNLWAEGGTQQSRDIGFSQKGLPQGGGA